MEVYCIANGDVIKDVTSNENHDDFFRAVTMSFLTTLSIINASIVSMQTIAQASLFSLFLFKFLFVYVKATVIGDRLENITGGI